MQGGLRIAASHFNHLNGFSLSAYQAFVRKLSIPQIHLLATRSHTELLLNLKVSQLKYTHSLSHRDHVAPCAVSRESAPALGCGQAGL